MGRNITKLVQLQFPPEEILGGKTGHVLQWLAQDCRGQALWWSHFHSDIVLICHLERAT